MRERERGGGGEIRHRHRYAPCSTAPTDADKPHAAAEAIASQCNDVLGSGEANLRQQQNHQTHQRLGKEITALANDPTRKPQHLANRRGLRNSKKKPAEKRESLHQNKLPTSKMLWL